MGSNFNYIDTSNEPTTAVVRGSKRSLRARITAWEALKRDLRAGSVCLSGCLFGIVIVTSHKKSPYFVKRMRDIGPKTVTRKRRFTARIKRFFFHKRKKCVETPASN